MCVSDCGDTLSLAALTTFCGNTQRTAIIGGYVDDAKQAEELESCVPRKKRSCVFYTLSLLLPPTPQATTQLSLLTVPSPIPPSSTNSPFLPALPQQRIHGWSMPTTLCARHWRARRQRVGMSSHPLTILPVLEALKCRQLFSVLLQIILPWLLGVSLQGSARQRIRQRKDLCVSNQPD